MKQFCNRGHDTFIVGRNKGHCKECRRIRPKTTFEKSQQLLRLQKWREQYPERSKEQTQKANWRVSGINITIEQYKKLKEVQNNLCAICKKQDYKKQLGVDHNHKTGKVRGLLCITCNNRIVKVVEDFSHLIPVAQDYLKQYE